MGKNIRHDYTDPYPEGLQLALNKAQTVSSRLGVAWTLVSDTGRVLACSGNLFNQHIRLLLDDLEFFPTASRLYISYCPVFDDAESTALLEALCISKLIEIHVYTSSIDTKELEDLSRQTAITVRHWPSDNAQTAQSKGIAWIRTTHKPWVHIICSNSLGGGVYPLEKMSEQLGVLPYVRLKALESSLIFVQKDGNSDTREIFNVANPNFVPTSKKLVQRLSDLSASTASAVTVLCDSTWLAQIVSMSVANEVSYFLSLRTTETGNSISSPIIEFPKYDHWTINSSEVMGDFIQISLQKGCVT